MSPSRGPRRWAQRREPLRRRSGQRRRAARRRHVLLPLLVAIAVAVAALVAAIGFGGASILQSRCSLDSLRPAKIGQNSFVYAADGTRLGSIPAERNRQPVSLAEVSPWMRKATVAIEDRRFYQHGGVDYRAIVRAAWRDLREWRIVEGGSTITQQLVRNLYTGDKRTFGRKLKEVCLAIKLGKAWSKDRILKAYMNQVYYGNHAYGVEAAAQTYYSKHATELTLPQAALLAGLPQAPSAYDPFYRPSVARSRRNEVLRAMLANADITQRRYRAAARTALQLQPGKIYTRIKEPYFFGYVRDRLIQRYGASTVRSGGLRVYTTILPRYQRAAVKSIRDTLYYRTDPASALVSIDPATGAIRAMTGVIPGRARNEFNLAVQARRQAGSTFKAFVLTTAVSQGINPDEATFVSAPFHYQQNGYTKPWDVSTYDNTYSGEITVDEATLRSDNTVYAQLTLDVGPENVAAMAHRLGVRTKLPPVPSLGLGSIAVSPLEMASAYATLAAGGVYSRPMAIRKVILPNGDVDTHWGTPVRTRVIPDGVAYEVTKILEQNMLSGTGVGAYFSRPAAGKTGTTENNADAWFCGYTPTLATVVWIGYPGGEIPMDSVHGITVSGPTFPATIWRLFMESSIGSTSPVAFPLPTTYPVWKSFERGPYAIQSAPVPSSGGSSSGGAQPSSPTPKPQPLPQQGSEPPPPPPPAATTPATPPPPPPAATTPTTPAPEPTPLPPPPPPPEGPLP